MREALWYYDNYWIEKERADDYAVVVESWQAQDAEWSKAYASQGAEVNKLNATLAFWRPFGIITGTVGALSVIALMVSWLIL